MSSQRAHSSASGQGQLAHVVDEATCDAYGVDTAELQRAQRADALSRAREDYKNDPSPSHRTYGPKTRRERMSLLSWSRGRPD